LRVRKGLPLSALVDADGPGFAGYTSPRGGTDQMGGPMGVKWSAKLKVDFEMDEGVSAHLAEARLKVSAAEFQRFIESGHGNGRTRVKPGSAKVDIVTQGRIAW
jgi:hypothetical protein